MKVAIVHDFLNQMGGAELVVKVLREIFPEAPIYTSVYIPSAVCPSFATADIRTSFMQKLPLIGKHSRKYLPLYPYAFESFDFSEYDVVLSSSSSFAKGIVTPPHTCHICYCYNPMRFAWNYGSYIEQEAVSPVLKKILPHVIHRLRIWDAVTADRVDSFISISGIVRSRIAKYYRRDSTIIYPPVHTSKFAVSENDGGYYVILSRLLPYKKIDIAVQAFNKLKLPLKIVGGGRDADRLKSMAGPTVELLGRLSDEDVKNCLAGARAVIFPGLEDFGLVPVEAMACGKPVIAYAGGGALDTVVDGVTGVFFYEQTPESLADAVVRFRPGEFDPWAIRRHAERFDVSVFKKAIEEFVSDSYQLHTSQGMFGLVGGSGILPRMHSESVSHQELPLGK